MQDNIIVITGITASGKSELCNQLIHRYNNLMIINCDSKQIYKDIPIITDQPHVQEKSYKLYGYVNSQEQYSVGLWLEDAKKEILNALHQSYIPIITGGSGLYVKSLIQGISLIPQINLSTRQEVQKLLKDLSAESFYQLVLNQDPRIQDKIFMNDVVRLARALEVMLDTGKSIFEWHNHIFPPLSYNFKVYTILPKRKYIYEKINMRVLTMIENGAIDEVKNLLDMNLDPYMPVMRAHGVPEIIQFLNKNMSLEQAIEVMQRNIRQYAKRQYTWCINQFPNAQIIECVDHLIEKIFSHTIKFFK
ncbi:tRNA (adenosine(37)-N6)-dimethylallyltransferase MiaA [Wolbachia endosymbiont of Howardula sp.]|uniref:tRNA (adenosine(37)-N6)-dimethylallyltransferase MiaA n=1 Tax=Wolbachia endosymbiont of Howardula sp. TaxID=2916816 RepID=UPI00217D9EC0|nr:tRNA (adenosine(37)-N6)-dimethylallyltransferase MiaA [Wolbachia endosymbiont of Howardula sp.]UWI83018.1 tRNA (adenosine(37)-N6)-dimethylallyltransferase MiaA [Wolbachia endosymbiont of Howardula sp.]